MPSKNLPQVPSESTIPDLSAATALPFSPNGVPTLEPGPDPFDPESLRLPQDFQVATKVRKALLTIPVKKPNREWFIRVHPDTAYHLHTRVIEIKNPDEVYLVNQALAPELEGEITFTAKMLFLAINRQNIPFFWPVRMPGNDGRRDNWSASALDAAQLATTRWVRVTSDMTLGAYQVLYAEYAHEPEWPEQPMHALLRIAFRDRYIDSLDHPILKQLRGEVA
jgi:hypothetical protein